MREERTSDRYFWAPTLPLVAYSGYMAWLFSFGEFYGVTLWFIASAVVLGVVTILVVAWSVRRVPYWRSWVSGPNAEKPRSSMRPGLGPFLGTILCGVAPFLVAAASQELLAMADVGPGWLLAASAVAVFVFIFAGYRLIESLLNRRPASGDRTDTSSPATGT